MRNVPPEPTFDVGRFPPAIPGSRIRQTLRFSRDPLGELRRARERFGPVFTLRMLPYRSGVICVTDSECNRQVLTDHDRFAAGEAAELIAPIVGDHSLIVTPAPQHMRNRRLLMPAFHGRQIARWGDVIGDLANEQLPGLVTGEVVPVRPWAQRLTLDVILRVVFGIESPARREVYRAAMDRLADPKVLALLAAPSFVRRDLGRFSPGGAFARRKEAVETLLNEEIAARRADPEAADKQDVLSLLLEARDEEGVGFTDAELRDELKGLVIAGHETTATALAWTLHLLAQNRRARDALLADLDAGSTDYLRATIKESMRLRAPVFDAIRIATRDTELAGQPIPAGSYVSATFSVIHLDPDEWADPDDFRPERHLEQTNSTWSLTPFGGGSRRCLGAALAQLELEVVLSGVLRQAVPEPVGPPESAKLLGVTVIPSRGGRVLMRAR